VVAEGGEGVKATAAREVPPQRKINLRRCL
jgi:hypothetical protein